MLKKWNTKLLNAGEVMDVESNILVRNVL
jgi:hypothetical protein